MTGRERMRAAMHVGGALPDRVPLMCQLALGHYFLQSGLDPVEVWHDTPAFGDALLALQRRYGFDGILVNLPGRPPDWRNRIAAIDRSAGEQIIRWRTGARTAVPADENPHVYLEDGRTQVAVPFDAVDPDRLFYVEPHDLGGVTYPCTWSFAEQTAAPGPQFFPPWHWDTIRYVRERAPDVAVHGEVFSPFSQLMELVGCEAALAALLLAPDHVQACLDRLADGAIILARGHFAAGADAVLVSSAFAGAGFISKSDYRRFVLPYERKVIEAVKAACPRGFIYTHTCGAIGDRLDLMADTGTDGIDTLDPPPLGNVDLAEAKRQIGSLLFLKGNVDPVNTVLLGTAAECYAAARERIAAGKPGGGYILSTACSVPPHTPPGNLEALCRAVEEAGYYG